MDETRDPRTYAIIGAAMAVHSQLGPAFLEVIYHDAFEIEMRKRGIPYVREAAVRVVYDGVVLPHPYRADFICYGEVVVEVKAQLAMGDPELRQLAHYLSATGHPVGILINFGADRLKFLRVIPPGRAPVSKSIG